MKRSPRAGLFTAWWTTLEGKRIRRVRRGEYGELYRLAALGKRWGLR